TPLRSICHSEGEARKNPANSLKSWIATSCSALLAMTTLLQDYLIPRPWWERGRVRGQKAAFTLAEVLITLGIIGIVAAMTIPNLLANYQKRQTITKLKQVYSTLTQTVKLSEAENGSPEGWKNSDLTSKQIFEQYLRPYMNVSDKKYNNSLKYKRLNGEYETNWTILTHNAHILTLNNGSLMFLNSDDYNTLKHLTLAVDINGFSPPNKIGRDFFVYTIPYERENDSVPKVVPYGVYGTSDYPFGE
ncbi:MAG: type II secretion system GspH family protein, partial [Muribaculaceae bacterium]|nr:type II secretion system GspH family protein [Muribaculaceae bacterium]